MSAFCLFVSIATCFLWQRHEKLLWPLQYFWRPRNFCCHPKQLTFDSDLFWNNFTELVFVIWIHIHICQHQNFGANRFDNFSGYFSQDVITRLVFLVKKYLEIVGRITFNNIQKEIFPDLLSLLLQNKPAAAEKKDFCIVFYSMAAGFCYEPIRIFIDCADSSFLRHILYSYEKPSDFTSKKLFFSLEVMKDLILCSNVYLTIMFF